MARFALTLAAVFLAATALRAIAADDAAKKAQILASREWKQVESEFNEWLKVQVLNTPQQVQQLKGRLKAEIEKMSASDLQQFLDQWNAKLKVLLSKDADETRAWLAQNLMVMADGYRKQFLAKLGDTDVSKMTAAQIEDEIMRIRAQRLALQQKRAVFDYGRQQETKIADQLRSASSAALQDAGSGEAAKYGTYQSQYSPREYNYQPLPPLAPFWW